MAVWDPAKMKAQLRLTAQKLGQLQDKMESQGQITRRDIATLLQQDNIAMARAKALKLVNEDVLGDLLQILEMHIGVILGHLNEFERSGTASPAVLEAAASIVIAAPQIDSKELRTIRDLLAHRLGSDFVRSAHEYVSGKVREVLSTRPPSATRLDQYIYGIAQANGVRFIPDLLPNEKVNVISQMLDPSTASVVDITRLRMLCAHGLPDYPPWLRPKVWRLLLGTLPVQKESWVAASRQSRDQYYDLVRRLLEPFSALPPPTSPLASLDASLMTVAGELSQVPPRLMLGLRETPESSAVCPLDETAADDIKILCASNLDVRIRAIKEFESNDATSSDYTPEIRVESTPEIRLEDANDSDSDEDINPASPGGSNSIPGTPSSAHSVSTTLLPSRPIGAHQKHVSALLRLLYVHSCLNPANQSSYIASLLVPVYTALVEEVSPEDAPHIEADTFWLFESIVGEFAELSEDGGNIWSRKLSERLLWADSELAEDLQVKGLDPALPHYSFRWLIPVLTHTLALPSVLTAWDALLSCPMRDRKSNPKLEYLIDICTAMLVRAKNRLLRLGTSGSKSDLWSSEIAAFSRTPLGTRELEDAFAEGMTFLQQYTVEAAGGIDAVMQTAYDLANRRELEANNPTVIVGSLGARLRDTVWKGLVHQAPITESHYETETTDDSELDDETYHEHSPPGGASTFTARLTDTVWRGISNQSAMEAPPSPPTPSSPVSLSPEPTQKPLPQMPHEDIPKADKGQNRKSIWGYAEKFKQSDTAATLAKVSTNWTAKAMDAWNKRSSGNYPTFLTPTAQPPPSNLETRRGSLSQETHPRTTNEKRRGGSLPGFERPDGAYEPPPRPAFFRPPRDSMIFTGSNSRTPLSPTSGGEGSPHSEGSSAESLKVRGSLAPGFTMPERASRPKSSGPRPLLLSSASLMSGRSPTNTPPSSTISEKDKAWADTIRGSRRTLGHKDSMSSISSTSPLPGTHSRRGTRTDLESDTTSSRIVPLRSSRSPMAPRRPTPTSSTTSSPPKGHRRMDTEASTQFGSDEGANGRNWNRSGHPDSPPTTGPSPPPPRTPDALSPTDSDIQVRSEYRRESLTTSESTDGEITRQVRDAKPLRRTPIPRLSVDDSSDTSTAEGGEQRGAYTKVKRLPPRLATARARDGAKTENGSSIQNSLTAEWSDEHDNVTTPRATTFDASETPNASRIKRARKVSTDGHEPRPRKISTDGHSIRSRKNSGDSMKPKRESSAVEGDDEGYNDLLSAYESEDA